MKMLRKRSSILGHNRSLGYNQPIEVRLPSPYMVIYGKGKELCRKTDIFRNNTAIEIKKIKIEATVYSFSHLIEFLLVALYMY